jgi:hypothetical protein
MRLTLCAPQAQEQLMKDTRARQILQALVQGIDPFTAQELAEGTVLQHADVLRALLAGVGALEQIAARAQRRAQLPGNVGRAWSSDEEQALVTEFRRGEMTEAIAALHGRTLRAIEARLERLGLLAPEQRSTHNRFIHAQTVHATAPRPPSGESADQDRP